MVERIESMLQRLYNFFAHSPKKHLEYVKLAEVMETKGLKILKNIKTQWISMLSLAIRVMNKYKTLLVKISQDVETMATAKTCFSDFTDIRIVLGLACIMPMLCTVHSLMQYAQKNDVFICDFLAAIKIC
jgi:hypothetical protein